MAKTKKKPKKLTAKEREQVKAKADQPAKKPRTFKRVEFEQEDGMYFNDTLDAARGMALAEILRKNGVEVSEEDEALEYEQGPSGQVMVLANGWKFYPGSPNHGPRLELEL